MRRDVSLDDAVPRVKIETAKPSPKADDGAVCIRWVRCGDRSCHCMSSGPQHGPYYARYWWQDGRRYKRYIRQQDGATISAACADRRERERTERALADAAFQAWRNIRDLIREVERGER